jgi:ribonuclease BN (tRNA processing enzyme)
VLFHDCSALDDEGAFAKQVCHNHITPVAQLAVAAQAGHLILVHLNSFRPGHGEPELDRAHPIFPRTEVAFDGMEIEF